MPRHRNSPEVKAFGFYLGRTIKVARGVRKMKAHALAEDIGVAAANVSAIETGKSLPTLGTLQRIAKVLDVPMWQLVRQAERYVEMNLTLQAEAKRRAKEERNVEGDDDDDRSVQGAP